MYINKKLISVVFIILVGISYGLSKNYITGNAVILGLADSATSYLGGIDSIGFNPAGIETGNTENRGIGVTAGYKNLFTIAPFTKMRGGFHMSWPTMLISFGAIADMIQFEDFYTDINVSSGVAMSLGSYHLGLGVNIDNEKTIVTPILDEQMTIREQRIAFDAGILYIQKEYKFGFSLNNLEVYLNNNIYKNKSSYDPILIKIGGSYLLEENILVGLDYDIHYVSKFRQDTEMKLFSEYMLSIFRLRMGAAFLNSFQSINLAGGFSIIINVLETQQLALNFGMRYPIHLPGTAGIREIDITYRF